MTTVSTPEAGGRSRRVELPSSATAMVWMGPGRAHEAVAVIRADLDAGEVLVEVELATICGSDVHTTQGHRDAPTPLVLGHEQVGRVVAVGHRSPRALDGGPVAVGDRIVWSIAASCGTCDRCTQGMSQKCRTVRKYGHERMETRWALSGGFATHMHLLAGTPIVRVPEAIPATVLAPVSCGTATAVAALAAAEQIRPLDGISMLISGAGLIGLTATAIATDRGASVTVVDPDPHRRALAQRFGAMSSQEPGSPGGNYDIVLEASGSRAAIIAALGAAGMGGVVVLVGSVFPTEPVLVNPERTVRDLITIRGVHNYAPEHLVTATGYIASRWQHWPFADLVGAIVPLLDIDEGLRLSRAGGPVRVAVEARRAS